MKKLIERKGEAITKQNKFCMQKKFVENVCLSKTFDLRLTKKVGQFQKYLKKRLLPKKKLTVFFSTIHRNLCQNKRKVLEKLDVNFQQKV